MVATVVAVGTRRYELQNEVAAGPSFVNTPKRPVTALQLTARGLSAPLVARAEQEAGRS